MRPFADCSASLDPVVRFLLWAVFQLFRLLRTTVILLESGTLNEPEAVLAVEKQGPPRSSFRHPGVLRASYMVVVCSIWLIMWIEREDGNPSTWRGRETRGL